MNYYKRAGQVSHGRSSDMCPQALPHSPFFFSVTPYLKKKQVYCDLTDIAYNLSICSVQSSGF